MCDTYMGVEIETLVEDGVTLYKSKYSDWSQFIEDVQADIADYFDGERSAEAGQSATKSERQCKGAIYIDAKEADIEEWYVERFHALRETVFRDPDSFFKMYAHLTEEQADQTARMIWREINGKNLVENIEPTKTRASLVVEKGRDHRVTNVRLRRL